MKRPPPLSPRGFAGCRFYRLLPWQLASLEREEGELSGAFLRTHLWLQWKRNAITVALDGDASQLPPHVIQNVAERIQRAAKKNAALDAEYYQTIAGKLEFCDLRELQDTITSKVLWPQFEPRFANKETLNAKFGQLAELRNGIRHSRTVNEICRKEGEAAILWFQQVLGK